MDSLTVFDFNSHVFEPDEIWERYLDADYRAPARTSFRHHIGPSGMPSIIVNGRMAPAMHQNGINRQAIWRPGLTPDNIGALDPRESHAISPGANDPSARLEHMNEMGIHKALILPTLFLAHFPTVENADVAHALARAYNDWAWDFCQADPDRLLPTAVLPMQDVNFAIEETHRAAARGFKAVVLRPAFFAGRFMVHPSYAPLWRALEQSGLAVAIHGSPGSTNPEWTSEGAFVERIASHLQIGHNVAEAVAPLMDNALALNALLFCGHLEEYPTLKVAFTGGGATWLPLALEKAETYLTLMSSIRDVSLRPEDLFFNRPSLITFDSWEPSVGALPDVFGKVAAWGSRYPAHDTSTPDEAMHNLREAGANEEFVRDVMAGNAERFFGT